MNLPAPLPRDGQENPDDRDDDVRRRRGEWRREGLAGPEKATRWRYSSGVTILNFSKLDMVSPELPSEIAFC